MDLLYGVQKQGEACLSPTLHFHRHSCQSINRSINQAINQSTLHSISVELSVGMLTAAAYLSIEKQQLQELSPAIAVA